MKLSDLLKEIDSKTTIDGRWDDPNYLADLLLELGSYYATLGSHVAEAEQGSNLAESHYKVEREKQKLSIIGAGGTVAAAEAQARVETQEDEQDAISLKYKAKLLSVTRDGLRVTIDVIRSKLSFIKTDMQESGLKQHMMSYHDEHSHD